MRRLPAAFVERGAKTVFGCGLLGRRSSAGVLLDLLLDGKRAGGRRTALRRQTRAAIFTAGLSLGAYPIPSSDWPSDVGAFPVNS